MFKKPLDARLHQLIASNPELNLATVAELEFISNFQAIQVGVKNQFGYVKSKPESGNGKPGQQPPICRPAGPQQSLQQPIGSPLPFSHQQPETQPQQQQQLQQQQQQQQQSHSMSSSHLQGGPNPMMLQGLLADHHHHQRQPLYGNQQMESRGRFSGSSANMNP